MGFCPTVLISSFPAWLLQLLESVPVGISQIYGCSSPWTGGIFLCAILLSSPLMCLHAAIGSLLGIVAGKPGAWPPAMDLFLHPGLVPCNSVPQPLPVGLFLRDHSHGFLYLQTPPGAS